MFRKCKKWRKKCHKQIKKSMFIPGKNLFHPREKFWFFWKTYENIAKNKVNLESKLYFVFEKNCKIKFCSEWVEKSHDHIGIQSWRIREKESERMCMCLWEVCIHICVFYFLISLIIINLVAGKPCVFEKTRHIQVNIRHIQIM